ncbi:MAG: hypothetical protein U0992_03270 [Planctomycetaceae bacterium]
MPSIRLPAAVTGGLLTALFCVPLAPAILRLREWSPFLNYMPEGQPWWRTLGPLWWAGALRRIARRGSRPVALAATGPIPRGWCCCPRCGPSSRWCMSRAAGRGAT